MEGWYNASYNLKKIGEFYVVITKINRRLKSKPVGNMVIADSELIKCISDVKDEIKSHTFPRGKSSCRYHRPGFDDIRNVKWYIRQGYIFFCISAVKIVISFGRIFFEKIRSKLVDFCLLLWDGVRVCSFFDSLVPILFFPWMEVINMNISRLDIKKYVFDCFICLPSGRYMGISVDDAPGEDENRDCREKNRGIDDVEQLVSRAHGLAQLDVAPPHDARERRRDGRFPHVPARGVHRGARPAHLGAARLHPRLEVLVRLPVHGARLEEFPVPLEQPLVDREPGLGRGQVRARGLEREHVRPGVDLDDRGAGGDARPFVADDAGDAAVDLRGDRRLMIRLHRADRLYGGGNVHGAHVHGVNDRRRHLATGVSPAGRRQQGGEDRRRPDRSQKTHEILPSHRFV